MAKPASVFSLNATINTDPKAILAAANNADWYEMMAALHGCRLDRLKEALVMRDPPPPYHGTMVTLAPDAVTAQMRLIAALKDTNGFALKDSFSRLNLADQGLKRGFEAAWIWQSDPPQPATNPAWERIRTAADLSLWEAAWNKDSPSDKVQFPAAILDRPDIAIWGRRRGTGFDAGGIANRSVTCTGISNVFGDDAFAPLAGLAHEFGLGQPVSGYARDDVLTAACDAGFTPVGRLCLWFS